MSAPETRTGRACIRIYIYMYIHTPGENIQEIVFRLFRPTVQLKTRILPPHPSRVIIIA